MRFSITGISATWTLPPVQSTVQSSESGVVLSFSEIQLLQQLHSTSTRKEKQSLLEIQEEERSRQQEEDFLRWWTAEEERVRRELAEQELLLSQANHVSARDSTRKARGKKRKPSSVYSSPTASRESRVSSTGALEERKGREPHP